MLLVVAITCALLPFSVWSTHRKSEIESLHRMGEWSSLIGKMTDFQYKDERDLHVLILLVEAIVETKGSVSSELKKIVLPTEIRELLSAYGDMFAGNFNSAKTKFSLLLTTDPLTHLGLAAIMDYGVTLGNVKILKEHLRLSKKVKNFTIPASRMSHYEVMLAILEDDLERANVLIRKYGLDPMEYSPFFIRGMIDMGKHLEAKKKIDAYKRKFGFDHEIALLESEWVFLAKGADEMVRMVDGILSSKPQYWQLKRQKFFGLLSAGRESEAKAIFLELRKDHGDKPSVASDYLLYFGNELKKAQLLEQELRDRDSKGFEDSPEYLIAKARVFFNFLGRLEDAKRVATEIQASSPANLELFLLQADIARAEGRTKEREKWLDKYLKARPVNESVRKELIELRKSQATR